MHLSRFVLIMLLAAALTSCGKTPVPEAQKEVSEAVAAPHAAAAPSPNNDAPASATRGTRLRGQMVLGKDGFGFTPCGESAQRIASFDPATQVFVDRFLASGAHEFFIDAWAAQGADGALEINRIERVGGDARDCTEHGLSGVVFKAHGNEPFWALTLSSNTVVLERPEVAALTATIDGSDNDAGVRRIQASSASGKIEVRLQRTACSDGMSDALYAWTAQVQVGGQTLKGCGYSGQP